MVNGFMFVTSIWVQMCTDANWFGANLIDVNQYQKCRESFIKVLW